MNKKILSIILVAMFFTVSPAFSADDAKTKVNNSTAVEKSQKSGCPIGNKIESAEYPDCDKVVPCVDNIIKEDSNPTEVISGSVEKNIDITLQECIRLALGNNPKIRSAIEEITASDARIAQVWANYFPTLNWTTSASKNRNLLFNDAIGSADSTYKYYIAGQISVSQMIYDFGLTQNQATIQRLAYKGSQETLSSTVNAVIADTKTAYYNLLYSYDKKKVAEDNMKKYEIFYNQAKAFYEIGMKPKVDVTIAEVNLSNAKLSVIKAENEIDVAIARLNNIMGLPYITKFNVQERLSYEPLEITLDRAVEIAKNSRPDLKIAEIKVESARQTIKLMRKAVFPKLTFDADYSRGGKSWNSSYGYTLAGYLKFKDVNLMKTHQILNEAKALYDKELALAESTRNDVYLEIQKSYYNMIEKKNQLPVAFLGMKKSKENYELSFGRYRVGEASPTELKDSQVQYLDSQLAYYAALFEYNSAKATLEKAIGQNLTNEEEFINLVP